MSIVLKNKKIFIAGHKGMVGESLLLCLKKQNIKKIITIDRKFLDLTSEKQVEKFIQRKKPDIIINCAGKVGGIFANSTYPVEFLHDNIAIQLNLTKTAYKNNVKHYINLGSSCIYPKNSKQPMKEKYLLTSELEKTNEAYALAKIIGLKACQFYNIQYKTKYFTLLPCNLYGPNDNFDPKNSHFIPALIRKFVTANKKKIKNVEIWGSGKPMREIMHVNDLALAIIFVLEKKVSNDKKFNKFLEENSVINVGSGFEISIKEFAKRIANLTDNNSNLSFNTKLPDGTKRKILDNSIMKKMGWRSKISLNKGLTETINWFKANY